MYFITVYYVLHLYILLFIYVFYFMQHFVKGETQHHMHILHKNAVEILSFF